MSSYNLCGIGLLDHNTVIFQKEKGGGGAGVHIKITGMQDSNSQGRRK